MDKEIGKFYSSIGNTEEIVLSGLGGPFFLIALVSVVLGGLVLLAQALSLLQLLGNNQPVTHSDYYSPKVENSKEPQQSIKTQLFFTIPIIAIIAYGGVTMYSIHTTEDIVSTQEHIIDKLLIKAVNESKEEPLIIEDAITKSLISERVYMLDFTVDGKVYKDKEVLVLVGKQGEYTKQGFVKVDMVVFSEEEKIFLDEGYNTFRGTRSSKNLAELDYLYVIQSSESEG